MLWRLLSPAAFPSLPDTFISVSGFSPLPWGGSRWEGWGAVSTALSALSGSLCLPFTPHPAAPLPLFLFHYAFGKVVFLSCHVSGESFWVIKCCHVFLDFGRGQILHSPLPCRGCDFFFFLISMCLCLTRADCDDWCSGPPWGHLRTVGLASACRRSLEREHAPAGRTTPGNSYLRSGSQFLRINAQASLHLGKAI